MLARTGRVHGGLEELRKGVRWRRVKEEGIEGDDVERCCNEEETGRRSDNNGVCSYAPGTQI